MVKDYKTETVMQISQINDILLSVQKHIWLKPSNVYLVKK